jgi:hypothetical protein
MRNSKAKQLRKIVGDLSNQITRRVYRRLKKQYNKVPKESRMAFIEMSKETLNGSK